MSGEYSSRVSSSRSVTVLPVVKLACRDVGCAALGKVRLVSEGEYDWQESRINMISHQDILHQVLRDAQWGDGLCGVDGADFGVRECGACLIVSMTKEMPT